MVTVYRASELAANAAARCLTGEELREAGLATSPEWLRSYEAGEWMESRRQEFLDPYRAPFFPDDVAVRVLESYGDGHPEEAFRAGVPGETIWVRIEESLLMLSYRTVALNSTVGTELAVRAGDSLVAELVFDEARRPMGLVLAEVSDGVHYAMSRGIVHSAILRANHAPLQAQALLQKCLDRDRSDNPSMRFAVEVELAAVENQAGWLIRDEEEMLEVSRWLDENYAGDAGDEDLGHETGHEMGHEMGDTGHEMGDAGDEDPGHEMGPEADVSAYEWPESRGQALIEQSHARMSSLLTPEGKHPWVRLVQAAALLREGRPVEACECVDWAEERALEGGLDPLHAEGAYYAAHDVRDILRSGRAESPFLPRTLVQNVPTGALAASSRRRRRAKPEEYRGLFRSGFARRIRPRAAEGALGLFWTSVLGLSRLQSESSPYWSRSRISSASGSR